MQIVYSLCAVNAAVVADVIFFVLLIIFSLYGAKNGLIKGFFGLVSTAIALLFAFLFASLIVDWTDGLFGVETWLTTTLENAFSKIEIMTVDISAEGLTTYLNEKGFPAFLTSAVVEWIAVEGVEQGTILATVVAEVVSNFVVAILCGIAVFLVVKLIMKLTSGLFTSIVDKWSLTRALNTFLGAMLGFLKGLFIICGVMAVLSLIPIEPLQNFFGDTLLLRELYLNNPINWLLSLIIV